MIYTPNTPTEQNLLPKTTTDVNDWSLLADNLITDRR